MKILIAVLTVLITPYSAHSKPLDHLVLMVFDQMRPDYIDRFNLKNFKRLRDQGVNYPSAYVGHLAAETIVSHAVISTGVYPRELPWQDEAMFDLKGILGEPGALLKISSLPLEYLWKLMRTLPREKFLAANLKEKFPGTKVFGVGEKSHAAAELASPFADGVITFSKNEGICRPNGINVPKYITSNERFTVECKDPYGTEHSFSPLDGSHFVPGSDPYHQGGDIWVTDVALELMDRENWSGLMLTFGGIDKLGHVLGDVDGPLPRSYTPKYSFEEIVRLADTQLGRVIDALEKKNLLSRTLIVITADHGAQADTSYLGNDLKPHGGNSDIKGDKRTAQPFWIERLLKEADLSLVWQDTFIRAWLSAHAGAEEATRAWHAMSEISGIEEIYKLTQRVKGGFHYKKIFSQLSKFSKQEQDWGKAHNQELVDTMAAAGAPHLIGLLGNGYGFDLLGDHGGAQEKGQRIPMIFYNPGFRPRIEKRALKLAQVKVEVLRLIRGTK